MELTVGKSKINTVLESTPVDVRSNPHLDARLERVVISGFEISNVITNEEPVQLCTACREFRLVQSCAFCADLQLYRTALACTLSE